MGTEIGRLAVRRSILIDAPPERVWKEFESFERMRAWFGTGHKLTKYEPRAGALVETDAGHHGDGERLLFAGRVTVFEPPRELTFESDWIGHGWVAPPLITLRLTPALGGTLVELFHHAIERTGTRAAEEHRGFEGGWTNRQLEALRQLAEA
ncbi:MAG: SRPBCC domain-containing protein [Dehalococcoidia bacterium]|nr:SRPBCC domain-containing protein [Dehalococcoidia bacterium]